MQLRLLGESLPKGIFPGQRLEKGPAMVPSLFSMTFQPVGSAWAALTRNFSLDLCLCTAEVLAEVSRVLKRVLRLFLPVLFSALEYLS
jgi:hypothetical protein